jgi:hypothetical protein
VRERSAEINELITVDVPSDLQRVSHVIVDEVHERSVDSGMWCVCGVAQCESMWAGC